MTSSQSEYKKPRALAIFIGICGVLLLYLGYVLMVAGGSPYYVISGLTLTACGVLLYKGNYRGAPLYGIFLVITYLWSLYEVGFDAWALMPRVAMFSVIGLLFLLPKVRRGLLQEQPVSLISKMETRVAAGVLAVLAIAVDISNARYDVGTPSSAGTGVVNNENGEWNHYGATKKGTRFASADQINLENVDQLERAWEIRTGVPGEFKGTPIQVGNGLYLCTGQNIILSLDPDTGEIGRASCRDRV